ncbi:MAG TPA: glucosamine-6-phosphate deaminase [Trebonia sp.]|jgi:glucosamine-6-phosphate deaminase|nr:glucosamine-6-phosphate deaminase [Trebonia sp.]
MTSVASLRLVVADRPAASRQAARLLADALAGPRPVLGLATGSSVELVYAELATLVRADPRLRAGVSRAQGFALDEYVGLPAGDPNSYLATLQRRMAIPAGLPLDRLHVPAYSTGDDPGRYDEQIGAAGGVAVQLLGIGGNGHIGFNEPGSPLDGGTRLITLDERTRQDNARFFASLAQVPTQAVTQGIGTILRARRLVLLAFGQQKAKALAAALAGPVTPQLPASALQRHPDVIVLADRDAASLIPA